MESTDNPNLDFLHHLNKTPEQLAQYQQELTKAFSWAHEHKDAPEIYTNEPVSDIIIISWALADHNQWINQFRDAWNEAAFNWVTPGVFWISVARRLSTPEVESRWAEIHPGSDRAFYFDKPLPTTADYDSHPSQSNPSDRDENPFLYNYSDSDPAQAPRPDHVHHPEYSRRPTHAPDKTPGRHKRRSTARGQQWKHTQKWEHLWPSSRKIIPQIWHRAQIPRRRDKFPWCEVGIASLNRFTRVSPHQITRALKQLERFGLIRRIKTGYKGQGCNKFFVFLSPKMSGAFSHRTRHR